jgi:AcrR family transcriptional regulator
VVHAQLGLRERKKQKTRQAILEAASRLFAERGFDAVTVAEIAREAEVTEPTVFSHFPTKEDLFFSGLASVEARLVDAVRDRGPGEGPLDVFRRFLVEGGERLSADETADLIAKGGALIDASRSLQVREREVTARYAAELADLLAEETGSSAVEARAVAAALMGVHAALVAHTRKRVRSGWRGKPLAEDVRSEAERAFALLETGLGGYGVRPVERAAAGTGRAAQTSPTAQVSRPARSGTRGQRD